MKKIEFTSEQKDMIVKLAEIQCTQQEIAHVMGVSVDVIKKAENLDLIANGKSQGKVKLRRAQYRKAVDEGNPTMLIWLGKNTLGQSENNLNTDDNNVLPWDTK
tara:strand:+ start:427 stop:738 length:312 start_codon:yes stop_codon:yes gene_type:complete